MRKLLFAFVLLVVAHAKVIQKDSRKQKWNKSDLPSSREVFNAADTTTTQPDCVFKEDIGPTLRSLLIGLVINANQCIVKCYEKQKADQTINGVITDVAGKVCFCEKGMLSQKGYGKWKSCFIPIKNRNGGYTVWSPFSTCSQSCDGGVETRTRMCTNPSPLGDGNDCQSIGPSKEERKCNEVYCDSGCVFQAGFGLAEDVVDLDTVKNETECIAKCYELQNVNPYINGVTTNVKTGRDCICSQVMLSQGAYSKSWKSCFIPFKNQNTKVIFKGLRKGELEACLNEHNRLRALHVDTPPLVLDSKLTETAQMWAQYLALTNTFEHSYIVKGLPYGENLYQGGGDCVRATNKWYEEIKDYDYAKPDYSKEIGHFTQVVSKTVKKVGFGLAVINGLNKIVAEYDQMSGGQNTVMPLKTTG